jgi:hypothetical protein
VGAARESLVSVGARVQEPPENGRTYDAAAAQATQRRWVVGPSVVFCASALLLVLARSDQLDLAVEARVTDTGEFERMAASATQRRLRVHSSA